MNKFIKNFIISFVVLIFIYILFGPMVNFIVMWLYTVYPVLLVLAGVAVVIAGLLCFTRDSR